MDVDIVARSFVLIQKRGSMNKFQVKWSRKQIGKSVYTCTAFGKGVNGSDVRKPLVCEAVVKSVVGETVTLQPVNFKIDGEDGLHEVSSNELWFTAPVPAVLTRYKQVCQEMADSINGSGINRKPNVPIRPRQEKVSLVDVCEAQDYELWFYEQALRFADCLRRFSTFSNIVDYHLYSYLCFKVHSENVCDHRDQIAPETRLIVTRRVFEFFVYSCKKKYKVDVSKSFKLLANGRLSTSLLTIYKLMEEKGIASRGDVEKTSLYYAK